MTEETDERMDRATRIREMREGQRADDADADGSGDGETPADGGSHGTDAESATEVDGDADATPDGQDASDDDASEEDGGADDATTDATGDDSRDDATGGEAVDEPTAAARRAAQAAAAVTGSDSSAGTDAGPSGSAESGQAPIAGVSASPTQGVTGVELPDQESIEAALADDASESASEAAPSSASGRVIEAHSSAPAEETVRVLEFALGTEHYCLDIDHVEEIVKRDSITRVPNTPDYVEGVVDLRGQITTILDPKRLLDIDSTGDESLLVVFEPDAFDDLGAIGWVVDEVRQVVPVAESMITEAPIDADYVEGVIDRGDEEEFVIWTNPEVAIRMATGEAESDD